MSDSFFEISVYLGFFCILFLIFFIVLSYNAICEKSRRRLMHKRTGTLEKRIEKRKSAEASTGRKIHVKTPVPFDDSPEAGETFTVQADVFDPQIAEYFKAEVRFNDKMLEIRPDNIVIGYDEIRILKHGPFNDWDEACFVWTEGRAVFIIRFDDTERPYSSKFMMQVGKVSTVAYKPSDELPVTFGGIVEASFKAAGEATAVAAAANSDSCYSGSSHSNSSDSGFGGGSGHGGGAGRR